MAEVFRAIGEGPEGFERPFAMKRIHPHLSAAPEFSRMFVEEARISARLVHPNIVQVFEFVQQDGSYYIVMEPVDGVDMGRVFRRVVARQDKLSPLFCVEVARQVCRGLEFAHGLARADGQGGVVHRDVTPPNIMVDWNGTVKIVDFGISRAMQDLQSQAAEAGTVRGKVSYVAPELLQGRVADARSDVFSLAVVLHELLSGQRLFLGENDLETLKLVRELPIEPPSARNPAVKAALDEIVMRGLERDPAKRYQSAREMGDDLEEFVVRRQFSTRALGEQARELFPAGAIDETEAMPAAAPGPAPADDQRTREVTISVGKADAVVVLEGATERPRRATPPPLPSLPPPPPPAAAQAVVARPTGGLASGPIPVPAPPAPAGFRLSVAASLALVGVSLSAVVVALIIVVAARRAVPAAGALATGAPAGDERMAGAGDRSTGAAPRTVQIALDSVPQGATVALVSAGAGSTPGEPLGQTPLLVPLARGEAAVEVMLTKTGFAPLSFRVIANRDKDATAVLERETPLQVAALTTTAMAAATAEDEPRPRRKRSSRKGAHSEARAEAPPTTTSSILAAPPPPARPAAAAPAPVPRAALPATLAPASAPHR